MLSSSSSSSSSSSNTGISLQLLDIITNDKKYVYASISGASFICLLHDTTNTNILSQQRPLLSINLNNAQLVPTVSRSRGIYLYIYTYSLIYHL
jgi:hypothetical protein